LRFFSRLLMRFCFARKAKTGIIEARLNDARPTSAGHWQKTRALPLVYPGVEPMLAIGLPLRFSRSSLASAAI